MFDVALSLLTDFADLIPGMIALILIINLCAGLLWGDK